MIASTVSDLVTILRRELADELTDPNSTDDTDKLWKTDELLTYLTEASDATAKATLSLRKIVTLPVLANTRTVSLPRYVLHVYSLRLNAAQRFLTQRASSYVVPSDIFNNTGTPREYMLDYSFKHIELFPTPASADTLELQCSVTIQNPLVADEAAPFDDTTDQRLVLHYAKYLAYMKHDAETVDLERSGSYFRLFEDQARSRRAEFNNYRRPPGVVKTDW